ncbi:Protein of unknown function [Gryllus bimaculatus]|nr:Protein of unknown function [Gryllus bimaculatus]
MLPRPAPAPAHAPTPNAMAATSVKREGSRAFLVDSLMAGCKTTAAPAPPPPVTAAAALGSYLFPLGTASLPGRYLVS